MAGPNLPNSSHGADLEKTVLRETARQQVNTPPTAPQEHDVEETVLHGVRTPQTDMLSQEFPQIVLHEGVIQPAILPQTSFQSASTQPPDFNALLPEAHSSLGTASLAGNTGTQQGAVNADGAAASAKDTPAPQQNLTSRRKLAAALGIEFKDKGRKALLRTKVTNYFEEHQLPLDKKFPDLDHDTMAKLLVECTTYMNGEGYPWTVKATESFVRVLCHDATRDSRKRSREEAGESEVVKTAVETTPRVKRAPGGRTIIGSVSPLDGTEAEADPEKRKDKAGFIIETSEELSPGQENHEVTDNEVGKDAVKVGISEIDSIKTPAGDTATNVAAPHPTLIIESEAAEDAGNDVKRRREKSSESEVVKTTAETTPRVKRDPGGRTITGSVSPLDATEAAADPEKGKDKVVFIIETCEELSPGQEKHEVTDNEVGKGMPQSRHPTCKPYLHAQMRGTNQKRAHILNLVANELLVTDPIKVGISEIDSIKTPGGDPATNVAAPHPTLIIESEAAEGAGSDVKSRHDSYDDDIGK